VDEVVLEIFWKRKNLKVFWSKKTKRSKQDNIGYGKICIAYCINIHTRNQYQLEGKGQKVDLGCRLILVLN
jgi:hypothetical protein